VRSGVDVTRYEMIVGEAPVALFVLGADGAVRLINGEAERLLRDRPRAGRFDGLFVEADRPRVGAYLASLAGTEENTARHAAGQLAGPGPACFVEVSGRRLGDADEDALIVAITDITSARAREQALTERTLTDPLTGLPNLVLLEDRLRQTIRSGPQDGMLAMLDLERFRYVNERYGTHVGDRVLQIIASRLVRAVPDDATVARQRADEFLILLPSAGLGGAAAVLDAALAAIAEPVPVGDDEVTLTAAVGLAPLDAGPPEVVLRQADAARFQAKKNPTEPIVVYSREVAVWAENLWDLAANVARLEHERESLHHESRTDALTGIPNLRALEEALGALGRRSANRGEPASVLFLDLDRFGAFNKRRGDARGDRALRQVADTLAANCRGDDVAFRKGGEELVLLLPGADHEAALAVAERIRAAVEDLGIGHGGHPDTPVLTVTVGVATAEPGTDPHHTLQAAADATLAAKVAERRNCVVSAGADPVSRASSPARPAGPG
jgi:diguanylate cyclase (GGDEF)-like protein